MRLFEPADMGIPPGAHVGAITSYDGVKLRYARWDATGFHRGTVCIFTGIPETIEQYYETIGDFRNLGFAVAILDWRSQGGSERLLSDAGKVHVRSFEDYGRDFTAFSEQVVRKDCKPPYYCLAHSGGSLIALYMLAEPNHCFDRAIALAPAIRTEFHGAPDWWVRAMGALLVNIGLGARTYQRFDAGRISPHGNPAQDGSTNMTSDPIRSERYWRAFHLDPSLLSTQRTYAWFLWYFRAVERVTQPEFGHLLNMPVLITHGSSDHIAPATPIRTLTNQMPQATYLEIPGARHVALQEPDSMRSYLLDKCDEFLP